MLNNKSVLITGGTGSFGKAFAKTIIERFPEVKRLVVFSRDELKQYEMGNQISHPNLRYFIGDVRDRDRLERALAGIHVVVHAAALKQVPAAEYNPMECIKTNILGAENLINAALDELKRRRARMHKIEDKAEASSKPRCEACALAAPAEVTEDEENAAKIAEANARARGDREGEQDACDARRGRAR